MLSFEEKKSPHLFSLLWIKAAKYCVFHFIVNFFSEISNFSIWASNHCNYLLKNLCEIFILEHKFSVTFQDIENCVTSSKLNSSLTISKRISNRWDQAIKELSFFL